MRQIKSETTNSKRAQMAHDVLSTRNKIKSLQSSKSDLDNQSIDDLFSEEKLNALHDRIMSGIVHKKPKPKRWFYFRTLGALSQALTLMMFIAAFPGVQGQDKSITSGLLLKSVVDQPEQASRTFSYQLQDEFLMDVAQQRVDDEISRAIEKVGVRKTEFIKSSAQSE